MMDFLQIISGKKSHKFSTPPSCYLFSSNHGGFSSSSSPNLFVAGRWHPSHSLDLVTYSFTPCHPCPMTRAIFWHFHPAEAVVTLPSVGQPQTKALSEGKAQCLALRDDLFYHAGFRDLSLPLPSSIRTVKKICFKHATGTASVGE